MQISSDVRLCREVLYYPRAAAILASLRSEFQLGEHFFTYALSKVVAALSLSFLLLYFFKIVFLLLLLQLAMFFKLIIIYIQLSLKQLILFWFSDCALINSEIIRIFAFEGLLKSLNKKKVLKYSINTTYNYYGMIIIVMFCTS